MNLYEALRENRAAFTAATVRQKPAAEPETALSETKERAIPPAAPAPEPWGESLAGVVEAASEKGPEPRPFSLRHPPETGVVEAFVPAAAEIRYPEAGRGGTVPPSPSAGELLRDLEQSLERDARLRPRSLTGEE